MLQNESDLFTLLSDQIGRKITVKNGKIEKLDFEGLRTTFGQARRQLLETFGQKFSNDDEKEEISAYLMWLLNKLFLVALHDVEEM